MRAYRAARLSVWILGILFLANFGYQQYQVSANPRIDLREINRQNAIEDQKSRAIVAANLRIAEASPMDQLALGGK